MDERVTIAERTFVAHDLAGGRAVEVTVLCCAPVMHGRRKFGCEYAILVDDEEVRTFTAYGA